MNKSTRSSAFGGAFGSTFRSIPTGLLVAGTSVLLAACGGGGGSSSVATGTVSAQGASEPQVTWYSAAQPLIERYCSNCHTDGGVAPFAFDTYEQVHGKRSAIAYSLEADTMPPLGFADLTDSDAALLKQWLDNGAPEGDPSDDPVSGVVSGFTYHGDTRAIIERHCVACHTDGGVAPFPLETYQQVKSVAAAAAFAVESGDMPPWPPTVGYTKFSHSRALAPADEYALLTWLNTDVAEGNPADYVAPEPIARDTLTEDDYNLKMPLPEPYTPKLYPDDHRCFAIEWPHDDYRYVTSVDVIPDQVAEVHHTIVNIVEPEDVADYLAENGKDGDVGWPCLLSGGLPGKPLPRQIGGWVPGAPAGAQLEGSGIGVEPGSLVVVQMHYNNLVAEPTPDQSTILIQTVKEVERPSSGFLYTNPFWLREGGMPIPAGDDYVHHSFEVPTSVLARLFGAPAGVTEDDSWAMHTGFLHMHNIAETGRVTLIRENGTEQVIIDIRDWDFNWQTTYGLAREVLVTPNDRVRLECSWDNSAANQYPINGVKPAPRDVDWGDGTGDEMCLTNFLMTLPKAGYDYSYEASVHIESPTYRQKFAPGDLVPLTLLFNNFNLHEPGAHGGGGHSDGHHDDTHGGDHSKVYEGHYHVYLDTDDDSAEHLTAWDSSYFFELPANVQPGLHTLRVSLRGTDHHAIGVEQEVVIEVVDEVASQSASLVDVNAWTVQGAAEDSFADHRPANVDCPDNNWYNEDGALEVETGYCNYLSLGQPSLTELRKGDKLHLVLWHGDLAFRRPARAHVAISVDGRTVWEERVEIPADAGIFDTRIDIDFDAPAGSKVEYHLHNHGYNTWTLLQLEVER